MDFEKITIAVLGLGYVGLPLAVEFSKKYKTIGFDIKKNRVAELSKGMDSTLEVSEADFKKAGDLSFSCDEKDITSADIYIVTVPTPIDAHRNPDLTPLIRVSEMIGRIISQGNIVIYESTVYPGATEEDCIPVVESVSGLVFNKDFFAGYSPERINPGDKSRPVSKIMKVTSGSTVEVAETVDRLYKSIITAGTFKAKSIKVAEASKIIENTQRDVNIALINEISMVFDQLGINTGDVIEAASTKWNFIKLQPGLVGGHCIGVDPYYLVHKSMSVGYIPDIIRKAREINDGMARFVASKLVKEMINNEQLIKKSKVLVMGVTFKENCPDIRNSKVIDLCKELEEYGLIVDVYDPWVSSEVVFSEYGINKLLDLESNIYAAVVVAVAHDEFKVMAHEIMNLGTCDATIFDMKNIIPDGFGNIIRM